MCKNECISEGICRHNEECYDDLCFTSEQLKIVDKWLAENRNKTIDEFAQNLKLKTHMENRLIDILAEQMKEQK